MSIKRIGGVLVIALGIFFNSGCSADQASDSKEAALNQARQDYRTFLDQLKSLNSQYKEITTEIQKVVKEEGLPVWDVNTGQSGFVTSSGSLERAPFGDADIKETEKEMIIKVDLPGVKKEAINIKIENGKTLRIQGTRDETIETKEDTTQTHYQRVERLHGKFERVIELPAQARETGTEAKYENGVLTVRIPKATEAKKEVAVSVK